jgi:ABC-2 type transport system permease protein
MIGIIARKEFQEISREARFRWTAAAVLLLLAAALISSVAGVRRASAERTAAMEADRREWLAQGPRNPHVAAHFGMYAFKPAAPLALLDRGVETFTGSAIWIEAHNQNPAQFRAADDATSMIRFGELTAATVLQTLVPLLIIVVAFPLFARERETGTLRQLLSIGIAPARLAVGKVAGVLAALALVLLPAIAIGVVALSLASELPLARLLLLGGAYGAYFLALVAVVIAVSAHASTSRAALVTLLGFWIATTFVIPRAAADLGERLHPTPTDRQFWAAVNADMAKRYAGGDVPRRDGVALQAGEDYGNRVFDRHFAGLDRGFDEQASVQRIAGVLSPYLAIRDASMSIAGSDVRHHMHFARAAELFRRDLQRYLNTDLTRNAVRGFGYQAGEPLWRNAPRFTYALPPLQWALRPVALSLVLLLAWLAVAAWMLARSV